MGYHRLKNYKEYRFAYKDASKSIKVLLAWGEDVNLTSYLIAHGVPSDSFFGLRPPSAISPEKNLFASFRKSIAKMTVISPEERVMSAGLATQDLVRKISEQSIDIKKAIHDGADLNCRVKQADGSSVPLLFYAFEQFKDSLNSCEVLEDLIAARESAPNRDQYNYIGENLDFRGDVRPYRIGTSLYVKNAEGQTLLEKLLLDTAPEDSPRYFDLIVILLQYGANVYMKHKDGPLIERVLKNEAVFRKLIAEPGQQALKTFFKACIIQDTVGEPQPDLIANLMSHLVGSNQEAMTCLLEAMEEMKADKDEREIIERAIEDFKRIESSQNENSASAASSPASSSGHYANSMDMFLAMLSDMDKDTENQLSAFIRKQIGKNNYENIDSFLIALRIVKDNKKDILEMFQEIDLVLLEIIQFAISKYPDLVNKAQEILGIISQPEKTVVGYPKIQLNGEEQVNVLLKLSAIMDGKTTVEPNHTTETLILSRVYDIDKQIALLPSAPTNVPVSREDDSEFDDFEEEITRSNSGKKKIAVKGNPLIYNRS